MSSTSKPSSKQSLEQERRQKEPPSQTFPNLPEPSQKKGKHLRGEKRNIFKLNLTQAEFADEQNAQFNTFQAIPNICPDSDDVGKVNICVVKDTSDSQQLSTEGPNLNTQEEAEVLEKVELETEIVAPTSKSENVSLNMNSIVLERNMDQSHTPETVPEVSFVEETGKDLNFSDLNQSNLVCLNDNQENGSQPEASDDDGSTLNSELDTTCTAARVQSLTKTAFEQAKPALDAAKDTCSTLNGQMSRQDNTKGEVCDLNLSDLQTAGCEASRSTFSEKIQLKSSSGVDIPIVSETNQPQSEAVGEFHSTLNDQRNIIQPGLTASMELDRHVPEDPGPNSNATLQEAAKKDMLNAEGDSLIDQVRSESEQEVGIFHSQNQNLEQIDPKADGQSKWENVSETTANSLLSEEPNTVTTPPVIVIMPPLEVDTQSPLLVMLPHQEVVNGVDSKGADAEMDNQKQCPATVDITTPIPDQLTPTTSKTTLTTSESTCTCLQSTPTPSKATPTSLQTTPTLSEATATPLQTQTSLTEDTPSESITSPLPAQPSLRAARLRGYLMKQGGALKTWKQRWFVFEEERNALVYFRTPRDMTPLGQVCLSHASFTCEGAEPGVFYMHTPERTVTLKAQSEDLKFYWLQQLQLRRWMNRPNSIPCDAPDTAVGAQLFPQLECVEEVNTEETTSQPLLLQLSLKHPLIELQNSVQILKRRSSNDCSQSVFHVPLPPLSSPATALANESAGIPLANQESAPQHPKLSNRKSSPGLIQVTPPSSQTTPTVTLTPPTTAQTTSTTGQVTMRRRTRSFLRRNTSSWSERSRLQKDLQDKKDLVMVLQKALELCQSEKRSSRTDQPDLSESAINPAGLSHSAQNLDDLKRRLDQTQAEVEELKTSLTQKDQTIQDLQKEIRELSEKNQAKQQVIQKMSSCMSQWMDHSSDIDHGSVQSLVQQNLNLQDDLKAFKKQNHFLNSEIHHLSGLWRTSTEGQRVLMSKVSAQRGQYLRVLRELQEVSLRDASQSEALKNIIQDALSQEQSHLQAQVHRDRDQYGFLLVPDFEVEDIKLLIKIQAPDLRSTQNQEAVERPLVARWDQFMSGCRGELSPSPELKSLIRTGIPPNLRAQVWNWIIRTRTHRDKDPLQYQQLCEQMESSSQAGSRAWSRQIDLDLPRTLCTNENFSSPSSPALQQLRRILLAFSWENPTIGYCQGLNRIAGLLLLVLGSEEDSFWALKAVVENIMPSEYYSPSLVGSQADQLVLKDFLAEKLPRLSSHLDRLGVDVSSSTFTWFLVVFVEVLPSHILLPLWDTFLYEGSKVLFRFSLALLKLKESEILQLSTPLEVHQYFRVLPKTVPDYRRLSVVAFDELNPFSRRALKSRRAVHLERLQRELNDLRQQQSLFLSQRSVRKSTEEESATADQEEVLDNNSEED